MLPTPPPPVNQAVTPKIELSGKVVYSNIFGFRREIIIFTSVFLRVNRYSRRLILMVLFFFYFIIFAVFFHF